MPDNVERKSASFFWTDHIRVLMEPKPQKNQDRPCKEKEAPSGDSFHSMLLMMRDHRVGDELEFPRFVRQGKTEADFGPG